MPLYYDSSAPTPTTKNTITRTATDFGIRDFLLHRNIQNPIKYPQLSTSINGSPKGGEPFLDTMVGSGVVIQHVPIEVDGIFRYGNAIIMNHYKDTDPAAPIILNIENITSIPIFPVSPIGTNNYQQEDITQYGILAKSNYKEYRKISTLKNLYVDAPKQIDIADMISLQPVLTSQQIGSYMDEYGGLNLGESGAVQAADIIGSVLNGQGLGLAKGGIVTNYDIRSSLAGRILGATGLLKDTKLGIIGGQQLALSLANNAAFNTQQSILGTLNLQENLLNLVKDGSAPAFRPNYKITVPSTSGGRILDTIEKVLGFTVPKSYLKPEGSIFQSENGGAVNIDRANSMILNTGKGQVKSLIANINANLIGTATDGYDNPIYSPFRSGYAPGYKDNKDNKAINPNGYVFMDNTDGIVDNLLFISKNRPIPEINYNRSDMIKSYGFTGPISNVPISSAVQKLFLGASMPPSEDVYGNGITHIKATTFSWGASLTGDSINKTPFAGELINDKKSILGKTQMLFNSKGMKTIVSTKGDMTIQNGSQIQTSVAVGGGISKGSGVLTGKKFDNKTGKILARTDTADNTFCRSWTTFDRYDSIKNLIRHKGLNISENSDTPILNGNWRLNTGQYKTSVLDDNGFVKIAPYQTDNFSRSAPAPKKYMFSIENLAWVGSPAVNLLPCEQGPGDLLTGKFGRIMWFPPYDLTFSESSSVNLESNLFIGRGEPLYTYNNTERTGNLSFKMIMDHPTIMNAFAGTNGPSDEFIRSWFAGCVDLDSAWGNKLTVEEVETQKTRQIKQVTKKAVPAASKIDPFKIYFKNDCIDIDPAYESAPEGQKGIGAYTGITLEWKRQPNGKCIKEKNIHSWPDNKSYGLNRKEIKFGNTTLNGWIDPNFAKTLKDYLSGPKFKDVRVEIDVQGWASTQGCIEQNKIFSDARSFAVAELLKGILKDLPGNISVAQIKSNGTGEKGGKYSSTTPQDDKAPKEARFAEVKFIVDNSKVQPEIIETYTDEVIPTALNQQVKKRFYSECSFFEKLTKDDPFVFDTIREKIRYFHPAFHSMTPEGFNSRLTFLLQCTRQGPTITKSGPENLAFGPPPVCILRVGDFYNTKIMIDNMSFDFDEQQWDLNPEGAGVQPMIVKVNMSFKYIGGSSLYGPINKLQNALTFNYFANAQVYDPRADYIASVADLPNSKIEKERTTFQSQTGANPKGELETNYSLVHGLDSTRASMGGFSNEVPADGSNNPIDIDQIKNNDKNAVEQTSPVVAPITTEQTANYKQCSEDLDNLAFGITKADLNNPLLKWTNDVDAQRIIFFINKKNVNKNLNQSYNVSYVITNQRDKTKYTYKNNEILKDETTNNEVFVVLAKETTPTFPILTENNADTYSLEIKLSGNSTPCEFSFTTPIQQTTVTQSDGDHGLFSNAISFSKYNLTNLEYNGTKLKGRFSIFNEGSLNMSQPHNARLSIYLGPTGGYTEIASFIINDGNNKNYGDFISKDGVKDIIHIVSTSNQNNFITFVITIPDYSDIKFVYILASIPVECPDMNLKIFDLIPTEDWDIIKENYCCHCWSKGTGNSKIIFNGITCPKNGSSC